MGQDVHDVKGQDQLAVVRRLYANYLGDKGEKMALFLDDGTMYVYGAKSKDPNQVNMSFGDMIRSLSKRGKGFQNVTAIVHNHDRGRIGISPADAQFWEAAQKYGFAGKYMIYDMQGQRLEDISPEQLKYKKRK